MLQVNPVNSVSQFTTCVHKNTKSSSPGVSKLSLAVLALGAFGTLTHAFEGNKAAAPRNFKLFEEKNPAFTPSTAFKPDSFQDLATRSYINPALTPDLLKGHSTYESCPKDFPLTNDQSCPKDFPYRVTKTLSSENPEVGPSEFDGLYVNDRPYNGTITNARHQTIFRSTANGLYEGERIYPLVSHYRGQFELTRSHSLQPKGFGHLRMTHNRQVEGVWNKNMVNGISTQTDISGQKSHFIGTFQIDPKIGPYIHGECEFHSKYEVIMGNCENGYLTGKAITRLENGDLLSESFEKGQRIATHWLKGIRYSVPFKFEGTSNDNGLYTEYDSEGKIINKLLYVNGKFRNLDGTWPLDWRLSFAGRRITQLFTEVGSMIVTPTDRKVISAFAYRMVHSIFGLFCNVPRLPPRINLFEST